MSDITGNSQGPGEAYFGEFLATGLNLHVPFPLDCLCPCPGREAVWEAPEDWGLACTPAPGCAMWGPSFPSHLFLL